MIIQFELVIGYQMIIMRLVKEQSRGVAPRDYQFYCRIIFRMIILSAVSIRR